MQPKPQSDAIRRGVGGRGGGDQSWGWCSYQGEEREERSCNRDFQGSSVAPSPTGGCHQKEAVCEPRNCPHRTPDLLTPVRPPVSRTLRNKYMAAVWGPQPVVFWQSGLSGLRWEGGVQGDRGLAANTPLPSKRFQQARHRRPRADRRPDGQSGPSPGRHSAPARV